MPIEYFRTVIDRLGDPVFVKDRHHKFVFLNKAMCETLGKPLDELVGKTVYDFYPKEQADLFTERDAHVLAGGKEVNELQLTNLQGHVRTISTTKTLYCDEAGEKYVVGVIRDISELKRANDETLRLNRELRAISECNQVLLRATHEQKLLEDICGIVCEEAGYRMAWVGYAENDAAKTVRPIAWAGFEDGYLADVDITWDDTERGQGPTGTAIRDGKIVYVGDFTTDPRIGSWREATSRRGYRCSIALPLKDESGKTFGALSIYSPQVNAFAPEEIRLLEELAGDLAFGIRVLRSHAERERAQEALRISESRLSQAMDLAKIVYWEYDPHIDQLILNDPFYAFYGTTAEREGGYRMSGQEYGARFVHPDDLARYVQFREDNPSNAGELLLDMEHRIIRRDGQVRHILV
ncbi:MAG: GAF domain-containing protein, partial [Syntrophorhabdales bacterium]